MNLLIYGEGELGMAAINRMAEFDDVCIAGAVGDGMQEDKTGIKIISMDTAVDTIPKDTSVLIAVSTMLETCYIEYALHRTGYEKIYIYREADDSSCVSSGEEYLTQICRYIEPSDKIKLPSIEIQVCDWCNLNCRGCTHFSALFDKTFPDFETRMHDLVMLKDIFADVLNIHLIGGEPLLNPELDRYIEEARKLFPSAEIDIVTNGLLFPKLDDRIIRCIKDNDVTVSISWYEPTEKLASAIEEKVYNTGVKANMRPGKGQFNIPLSLSDNSKHGSMCISYGCLACCDGMIARCPTLLYIDKFNERFGQKLPNEGIYKLEDFMDEEGALRLYTKLMEVTPLCYHCVCNMTDWSVCGKEPEMSDFAVED